MYLSVGIHDMFQSLLYYPEPIDVSIETGLTSCVYETSNYFFLVVT